MCLAAQPGKLVRSSTGTSPAAVVFLSPPPGWNDPVGVNSNLAPGWAQQVGKTEELERPGWRRNQGSEA